MFLILTSSESSSDFTLLTYRQGRLSLLTSALIVQVLPLPGGPVSNSPRFQGMEYRSYTSLAAKNRVRSSRISCFKVPSRTSRSKLAIFRASKRSSTRCHQPFWNTRTSERTSLLQLHRAVIKPSASSRVSATFQCLRLLYTPPQLIKTTSRRCPFHITLSHAFSGSCSMPFLRPFQRASLWLNTRVSQTISHKPALA